jgi:histidinol-phosphatase (PHP family)
MIDYHLHLWPHGQKSEDVTLELLTNYCDKAKKSGINQIAITEHLFRFVQADNILKNWWENTSDSAALKNSMANYWASHAKADLDQYINTAIAAKKNGLPIVVGLEVDYYKDGMDTVSGLLSQYPFDVLLGSIHWLGTWRFDDLDDLVSMNEWKVQTADRVFLEYADAITELAESRTCDVLAHPDLIKITGKKPQDAGVLKAFEDAIVDSAKQYSMSAEISSAGLRKPVNEMYPSDSLIEKLKKENVSFTTASDAHKLSDVGYKAELIRKLLDKFNIKQLAIFENRTKLFLKVPNA